MAKTKISEYDSTAANNTDIDSINIAEGMAPSNVNNAIRELMAHLKDGLGAGTPVFLDQTNNRLGVGTTSPSVLLDLESTAPTIRFTDSDASGTPECEISGAGGDITIRADRDNEKASSIIGFEVDGSERMRIDSSGLLRVGNTTGSIYNSSSVTGVVAASSSLQVASPSATTAFFNRQGNDGQIVGLYKDGSQIGSIGTYASDLTIGDADVGIRFDTGTGLVPWNVSTNAATDGAIDIGASSARIKDFYLSGDIAHKDAADNARLLYDKSENLLGNAGTNLYGAGIYLGGTAAVNHLDDYEEGTWTPSIEGAGSTGTYTYGEQQGHYLKIGNLVTAWINLTNITSSSVGTSTLLITGLPFAANYQSGFNGDGVGTLSINGYSGIDGDYIAPVIGDNNSHITVYFHTGTNNTLTNLPVTNLAQSGLADIRGVMHYYTAG